jgi:hypothetical protein
MILKIRDYFNSLHGLLRLYVALLVFVLLPIAVHEAKNTNAHRVPTKEIIRAMPLELTKFLGDNNINIISEIPPTKNDDSIDLNKVPIDTKLLASVAIADSGGELVIEFPKAFDEKKIEEIKKRIANFLAADESNRYWMYVFKNILFEYLMIAIAILLAGYAVVWNFLDFFKK